MSTQQKFTSSSELIYSLPSPAPLAFLYCRGWKLNLHFPDSLADGDLDVFRFFQSAELRSDSDLALNNGGSWTGQEAGACFEEWTEAVQEPAAVATPSWRGSFLGGVVLWCGLGTQYWKTYLEFIPLALPMILWTI